MEARIEAVPQHFQHVTGILAMYDSSCWYSIDVTVPHGETRPALLVTSLMGRTYTVYSDDQIQLNPGPVELRWVANYHQLQAWWRQDGSDWEPIGPVLDMSALSDEHEPDASLNFTGSWFGVHAVDCCGDGFHADILSLAFTD